MRMKISNGYLSRAYWYFDSRYFEPSTSEKLSCIIPEDITIIGPNVFRNCFDAPLDVKDRRLLHFHCESLILPEGLHTINARAFEGARIKHLYIPKSLKIIAPDAFHNCTYIPKIEIAKGSRYFSAPTGDELFDKKNGKYLISHSVTLFDD